MKTSYNRCWRSSAQSEGGVVRWREGRACLRGAVALLAATLLPISAQAQDSAAADIPRALVSVRVLPDTVAVGQPFVVTMRVVPPAPYSASAPTLPDTGGFVEPLDPAQRSRRNDTLFVRYRFLAWQPGVLNIPFGSVVLTYRETRVEQPVDVRVVVSSVLPRDSTARVPRPVRPLIASAAPWWMLWWRWVLGGVLLTTLGLLALARLRRPRRVKTSATQAPIERALAALTRLRARDLPTIGESARSVVLAAEILRTYLQAVEPVLRASLATSELCVRAETLSFIDGAALRDLLTAVDAVRFSGASLPRRDALALTQQMEAFIIATDRRRHAPVAEAA
jgi:hypothetical protein